MNAMPISAPGTLMVTLLFPHLSGTPFDRTQLNEAESFINAKQKVKDRDAWKGNDVVMEVYYGMKSVREPVSLTLRDKRELQRRFASLTNWFLGTGIRFKD